MLVNVILGSIIWCLKWFWFWAHVSWKCLTRLILIVLLIKKYLLIIVLVHIIDAKVWRWENLSYVELIITVWLIAIKSCVWMPLPIIWWILSLYSHNCLLQSHTKNVLFRYTHRTISFSTFFYYGHLFSFYFLLRLHTSWPLITPNI